MNDKDIRILKACMAVPKHTNELALILGIPLRTVQRRVGHLWVTKLLEKAGESPAPLVSHPCYSTSQIGRHFCELFPTPKNGAMGRQKVALCAITPKSGAMDDASVNTGRNGSLESSCRDTVIQSGSGVHKKVVDTVQSQYMSDIKKTPFLKGNSEEAKLVRSEAFKLFKSMGQSPSPLSAPSEPPDSPKAAPHSKKKVDNSPPLIPTDWHLWQVYVWNLTDGELTYGQLAEDAKMVVQKEVAKNRGEWEIEYLRQRSLAKE